MRGIHDSNKKPPLYQPDYDCASCGACCRSGFVVSTLRTSGYGWGPHHRALREHWRDGGIRERMRRLEDAATCAALVKVGARYRCGIYADRPDACRVTDVGSDWCEASRRSLGLSHHRKTWTIVRLAMELREQRVHNRRAFEDRRLNGSAHRFRV